MNFTHCVWKRLRAKFSARQCHLSPRLHLYRLSRLNPCPIRRHRPLHAVLTIHRTPTSLVIAPTGLVGPVLRNTEKMTFSDVEKTIGEYGRKARDGTLALEEMAGGTFTISNGGVFGSLFGTPIINPPQSAILGMHATKMRPMVMKDGSIEARPMMYLALTYDHRLIDGREAVTFLKTVQNKIEDPHRLLLDV